MQLTLTLEPDRNQPPKATPSTALLEVLAELLLAAIGTGQADQIEEARDERQDRR
jgi:hypothetical protein